MPTEATIIAPLVGRLVHMAERAGLDPATLCHQLGLSAPALADVQVRIPIVRYFELWEQIARTTRDPALPFKVAEFGRTEDLSVLGFALLSSRDGHEALDRLIRYITFITDAGKWGVDGGASESVLWLERRHPMTLGYRLSTECAFARVIQALRHSLGPDFRPKLVRFQHRKPRVALPHREFFACPVEFDSNRNEMHISNKLLARSAREHSEPLSSFLCGEVEQRLSTIANTTTITGRARDAIVHQLSSGAPSMSSVARRLGMSERTLRRHLENERTQFRALVEDVRHEWAVRLLDDPRHSVGEVAYALGFSDAAAFSRAFKRLEGQSPLQFRLGRKSRPAKPRP